MGVAVSNGPHERCYGGWLRADLERRLGRDAIVSHPSAEDDVLIVVLGPERDEATADRNAAAVKRGQRVIAVVLDGALVPEELGAVDTIPASVDYWDTMVERVIERIGLEPAHSASLLMKIRRPRVAFGAVIAALASIVAILTPFGVFTPEPTSTGSVTLVGEPTYDLTQRQYRELFSPPDNVTNVDVPPNRRGVAFYARVNLENPDGDRFAIHWQLLNAIDNRPVTTHGSFRAIVFEPDDANGLHALWVPCPGLAGDFVLELSLFDESNPDRPVDRHSKQPVTCA